jgi:chromosome segregation ATPase
MDFGMNNTFNFTSGSEAQEEILKELRGECTKCNTAIAEKDARILVLTEQCNRNYFKVLDQEKIIDTHSEKVKGLVAENDELHCTLQNVSASSEEQSELIKDLLISRGTHWEATQKKDATIAVLVEENDALGDEMMEHSDHNVHLTEQCKRYYEGDREKAFTIADLRDQLVEMDKRRATEMFRADDAERACKRLSESYDAAQEDVKYLSRRLRGE